MKAIGVATIIAVLALNTLLTIPPPFGHIFSLVFGAALAAAAFGFSEKK